ncbi:hypothetical protein [Fictibacillus macauensis]|nr:hypothetical protein [Fictibacillus macauensis]
MTEQQHSDSLEQKQETWSNSKEQEPQEGYGDKKLEGPNTPST